MGAEGLLLSRQAAGQASMLYWGGEGHIRRGCQKGKDTPAFRATGPKVDISFPSLVVVRGRSSAIVSIKPRVHEAYAVGGWAG